MTLSKKTKGMLVIILFMAILILPVCAAIIRERFAKHSEEKPVQPTAAPVGK